MSGYYILESERWFDVGNQPESVKIYGVNWCDDMPENAIAGPFDSKDKADNKFVNLMFID